MIPKIIHYCWFGGKPLPKLAKKCIESWKKYCPDYEIKEWNESNYNFSSCEYAREAYKAKKYAFVSDFARFDILYRYGGIYFDVDVELIKPIDPIVEKGAFMGVENCLADQEGEKITVAPGLGIAADPGMDVYKELLDFYHALHFVKDDGSLNLETVVTYTTKIFINHGLKSSAEIQKIKGITIYPKDFFNPCDMASKKIFLTERTVSIHHYAGSWISPWEKLKDKCAQRLIRLFGYRFVAFIVKIKHFFTKGKVK